MATIQRRGKVWRVQVRLRGHALSETFHSKQQAASWAREKEDAIRAGKLLDNTLGALTVGQAVARYEKERRSHRPLSRTIRGNLRQWQRAFEDRPLLSLTADDVITHAKRRECGAATMAIEVGVLKDLITIARTWGLRLPLDPVAEAMPTLRKLRRVAKPNERTRRPTLAELQALRVYLRANKRMPMEDIMDFAIASAMRLGEITRLRWGDLDEAKRLVLVRDRKDPQRKEGNHQWVPLLGSAFDIVSRQPRGELIFPYHPDSIGRAWLKACRDNGIDNLHFHDLRHEGVSRLFEAGYQIHEVAVVSGHRDWKSLKRYTQIRPESLHR